MLALLWSCSVEGPAPPVHPERGLVQRVPARTLPERPVVPDELWVAREDGLRTADLQVGEGEEVPEAPILVVIEATGWLPDGTPWWSTYETPSPTRFSLGQAPLRAWDRGVVGMRVGGVRLLDVPAALAFGEHGAAHRVQPDTPVQLLVELEALHRPRPEPLPMTGETLEVLVGQGELVVPGSRVTFDRTEWTADGTQLGTSFRDMVPPTVVIGEGKLRWEEALLGMREGGERQVKVQHDVPLVLSLVVHDVE